MQTFVQLTTKKERSIMKRFARPLIVAGLIASGVIGDRVLAAPSPAPSASAAIVTTSTTSSMSSVSATSLDAAVERAYAIASPSVVYVKSTGVGTGSGVIYDSTGDIVTNAHVISGAKSIVVTLSSGKTYTAQLVGTDTADDLAVIHISATGLTAARFASTGTYTVAETVLAIGNPLGLQESVTSGLISALNRTVQESNGAYLPDAIQTSAPINPGNSGGALVDLSGSIVGIPTLEATDSQNNSGGAAQGVSFAISSARVTTIVPQLIATGSVAHTGRAYLGVSATDASAAQSTFNYGQSTSSTTSGALVGEVSSGSPAAQAGIQQGDVITTLAGKTITGEDDMLAALAAQKPNTTVTIKLDRDGTMHTVQVKLGELSATS
jgi:putative serine protease PepD